jgi:hypothetical protein
VCYFVVTDFVRCSLTSFSAARLFSGCINNRSALIEIEISDVSIFSAGSDMGRLCGCSYSTPTPPWYHLTHYKVACVYICCQPLLYNQTWHVVTLVLPAVFSLHSECEVWHNIGYGLQFWRHRVTVSWCLFYIYLTFCRNSRPGLGICWFYTCFT